MIRSDPAIQWLLQSTDPSIRYFTLTDLLGASPRSREARAPRAEIPNGARVRALLAGQAGDDNGLDRIKRTNPQASVRSIRTCSLSKHVSGFGVPAYKKWNGAHWRLVSLVELGIPSGDPRAHAAADQVLTWLTRDEHRARIKVINGRTRRCGSQEGNALAVCSRLGMADDPRVQYLARSLVEWQWDDGRKGSPTQMC